MPQNELEEGKGKGKGDSKEIGGGKLKQEKLIWYLDLNSKMTNTEREISGDRE